MFHWERVTGWSPVGGRLAGPLECTLGLNEIMARSCRVREEIMFIFINYASEVNFQIFKTAELFQPRCCLSVSFLHI